jgi:hypothetical protein
MIQRRHFFHVAGFDPHDAAAQYRRFVREAARSAITWNVKSQVSAMQENGGTDRDWTVTTYAPGWQVVTSFTLLDWSDIVRSELRRPSARRLWDGMAALADLISSGTAWRYFTANWRYGMFFLVPFLSIFLFAATAILAAGYVAIAFESASVGIIAGMLAAILAFTLLMRWPGERWRVGQALSNPDRTWNPFQFFVAWRHRRAWPRLRRRSGRRGPDRSRQACQSWNRSP